MSQEPKLRLMNINRIVVDPQLQSRVVMDKNVAREFSLAMQRGDQFPPLEVFFDGEQYLLADGFHRVHAYRSTGRRDVRCLVREGDRRAARIFSAGANRQFSAKRSLEDIRRAIRMLLEDDEWFMRNDSQIANHVGCSSRTVNRIRHDYCRELGIEPPREFEDSSGKIQPAARHYSVSRRPGVVEEKRVSALSGRYTLEYAYIRDLFYKHGFRAVVEHGMGSRYPGIRAIHHHDRGIVATPCDFVLCDSLPLAVGRLMVARQIVGMRNAERLVLIGYRESGPQHTIAHAEELGIHFMEPGELIAEMKT